MARTEGEQLVAALKKRRMDAYYCETKQEALEKAVSLIPRDDVIAWGGSMSVEEIGLLEQVKKGGYNVIDRDLAKDQDEKIEMMRKSLLADTFLTGTNAITRDGQLLNIDGTGNRVAAMLFGPRNVIVIAGMNKVADDLHSAWKRARQVAAPRNAQRFDINTPCKKTQQCADCLSPDTICNYFTRIRACRPQGRIKVILVEENLGY